LLEAEDCGGGVGDGTEFAKERGDEFGKGAGDFFFGGAFGFPLLGGLNES